MGTLTANEERLLQSLKRAQQLFDVALPKFDWGKSPLSSDAIRLLNDVPREVAATIAEAERIKAPPRLRCQAKDSASGVQCTLERRHDSEHKAAGLTLKWKRK